MKKLYKVCEKEYNPEENRIIIKKIHNIYLDLETKTIQLESPMKVKMLQKIKRILKINNIHYDNLIIGYPDI